MKKSLGLNNEAETSRAKAVETWPSQSEMFARKRDHNRAEAALLGLYALKKAHEIDMSEAGAGGPEEEQHH